MEYFWSGLVHFKKRFIANGNDQLRKLLRKLGSKNNQEFGMKLSHLLTDFNNNKKLEFNINSKILSMKTLKGERSRHVGHNMMIRLKKSVPNYNYYSWLFVVSILTPVRKAIRVNSRQSFAHTFSLIFVHLFNTSRWQIVEENAGTQLIYNPNSWLKIGNGQLLIPLNI